MVFSSLEFILLLLLPTLVGFHLALRANSPDVARAILLIASTAFYMAWSVPFFMLLIVVACSSYWFGERLKSSPSKLVLTSGILITLAPLIFYKYAGWITGYSFINTVVLPLGISFYTFQQIGYLVDCFKKSSSSYSFRRYFLYVSFFPQLVAGPIVHHRDLVPQIDSIGPPISAELFGKGLIIFIIGLFKKIVIADSIAPWANVVFANPENFGFWATCTAVITYTLQLYYDFSGYSDMAIGLGLMFGIRLPVNFLSPYKSANIAEFWRTWHITLGDFFREYIYIPLGGNRGSFLKTCLLLLFISLVSGLWHGAGMTFLLWGSLHGLYLVTHRVFKHYRKWRIPRGLSVGLTFICVALAWIPFRAGSIDDTLIIFGNLIGMNGWQPFVLFEYIGIKGVAMSESFPFMGYEPFVISYLLYETLSQRNVHESNWVPSLKKVLLVGACLVVSLLLITRVQEFLYFNF